MIRFENTPLISRDRVIGTCVTGLGVAGILGALGTLSIGTLARMGPGMFPLLVSVILTFLGLLILFRPSGVGDETAVIGNSIVPLVSNISSVVVFGLMVGPFGLVPAVIGLGVLAGLAVPKPGLVQLLFLPIALAAIGALIFKAGLRIPVDLFNWPF